MFPIASQLGSLDLLAEVFANSGTAVAGETSFTAARASTINPFAALLQFGQGIEAEVPPASSQPDSTLNDTQANSLIREQNGGIELHLPDHGLNLGDDLEPQATSAPFAVGRKSGRKHTLTSSRGIIAKPTGISADLPIAPQEVARKWDHSVTQFVAAFGPSANTIKGTSLHPTSRKESIVDADYTINNPIGDRRYSMQASPLEALYPQTRAVDTWQGTGHRRPEEHLGTKLDGNLLRETSLESKGVLELDKRNSRWLTSSAAAVQGPVSREVFDAGEVAPRFQPDSSFGATNKTQAISLPEFEPDKAVTLPNSVQLSIENAVHDPAIDLSEGITVPLRDMRRPQLSVLDSFDLELTSTMALSEPSDPAPALVSAWNGGDESLPRVIDAHANPLSPQVFPVVHVRRFRSPPVASETKVQAVSQESASLQSGSWGIAADEQFHFARLESHAAEQIGRSSLYPLTAAFQNSSSPPASVPSHKQDPVLRANGRSKAARLEPQGNRDDAETRLVSPAIEGLRNANSKRDSGGRVFDNEKHPRSVVGETNATTSLRGTNNASWPGEEVLASIDATIAEALQPESNLARQVGLNEIARQIASAAEPDQGWILMEIQPPELGKLEILVARDVDGFSAQIVAHDRATGDALSQQRTELIEALGQQGLDLRELQIHSEPISDWLGKESGFQPDDHPTSGRENNLSESNSNSRNVELKPALASGVETSMQNNRVNIVV